MMWQSTSVFRLLTMPLLFLWHGKQNAGATNCKRTVVAFQQNTCQGGMWGTTCRVSEKDILEGSAHSSNSHWTPTVHQVFVVLWIEIQRSLLPPSVSFNRTDIPFNSLAQRMKLMLGELRNVPQIPQREGNEARIRAQGTCLQNSSS